MRKIEMKSWEEMVLEETMAFEVAAADDELVVFDSDGVDDPYDELIFGRDERDAHRWELDPASAEDFPEHRRVWLGGPSQRWRHFGH